MADDELNSPESQSGNQTENQNPPEVEELEQSAASRVTELEGLMTQKDEELTKANARIIELEPALADKDSEMAILKQSLAEAVASYKTMVVQANPQVLEELITGDTIAAINESLEKAKTLVSRVRQGLEAEIALAKVPAGAPERTPPDLSALSPREKINYAIGGRI